MSFTQLLHKLLNLRIQRRLPRLLRPLKMLLPLLTRGFL
jgi:hypothetical protein